ncbi:MAG: ATP-dependent metalloprotease, partial [Pseudomonadota bacterium]|nr:ATP-dependent metalloprotease [Pseudomonadota bacterium]
MAEALLEYETIDKSQIDDIMAGRKPQPPSDWNDDDSPMNPSAGTDSAEDDQTGSGKPIGDPAADL